MIDRLSVIRASGLRHAKKSAPTVSPSTRYHVSDYWSEGSRTETRAVNLLVNATPCDLPNYVPQTTNNPFHFRMGEGTLTNGVCIVQKHTFRGKDTGCTIICTPHDAVLYFGCGHTDCAEHPELAQACKASTAVLSPRDTKLIATVRGLKSAYRLDALRRMNATPDELGRLVNEGYLNRLPSGNYQATDKGREAAEGVFA